MSRLPFAPGAGSVVKRALLDPRLAKQIGLGRGPSRPRQIAGDFSASTSNQSISPANSARSAALVLPDALQVPTGYGSADMNTVASAAGEYVSGVGFVRNKVSFVRQGVEFIFKFPLEVGKGPYVCMTEHELPNCQKESRPMSRSDALFALDVIDQTLDPIDKQVIQRHLTKIREIADIMKNDFPDTAPIVNKLKSDSQPNRMEILWRQYNREFRIMFDTADKSASPSFLVSTPPILSGNGASHRRMMKGEALWAVNQARIKLPLDESLAYSSVLDSLRDQADRIDDSKFVTPSRTNTFAAYAY